MWRDRSHIQTACLLLFFGITGSVWFFFVMVGKMALSPTRHQMILIPMMILLVIEGVNLFVNELRFRIRISKVIIPWALSFFIVISFLQSFPQMVRDRKDPLDEDELIKLFEENKVQMVYQAPNMLNLSYMKGLTARYPLVSGIWRDLNIQQNHYDFDTLAFLSQTVDLTEDSFHKFVSRFNESAKGLFWVADLSDYDVIYSKVQDGVMMDYTHYSTQQRNSLRIFILKKKKSSRARLYKIKPTNLNGSHLESNKRPELLYRV